jgi:hypothetical protein
VKKLALLAVLGLLAAVEYSPGPWKLYRSGSALAPDYATAAACDAALKQQEVAVGASVTLRCQQSVMAKGVAEPVPPPPPPPVGQPAGTFTDLVSAPACAKVTRYTVTDTPTGRVTTKQVVTAAEAGIRIHAGRCIEVTPATIKTALSTWQAGDWYCLHAGTYSGVLKSDNWNFTSNFDLIKSPATAEQPIAIVGCPGEVAVLNGAQSRPNFIFANSGGGSKASHITVANLKLVALNTCIDSGGNVTTENSGGEFLRIVGVECQITATGFTATGMMNFAGNGSVALGNTFTDDPARQIINQNHAIYVHAGADNVEIGYNTLKNLRMGHVIQVHQDGVARDYNNIRIHHNLLEGRSTADMRGITVSNVSSASTVTVEANTLRNVGQGFSCLAVYAGNVTLKDNQIFGCGAPSLLTDGFALGSSGPQQRKITATGNRFDSNGAALFLFARGATSAEVTASGNMYCGGAPLAQDASPKACN